MPPKHAKHDSNSSNGSATIPSSMRNPNPPSTPELESLRKKYESQEERDGEANKGGPGGGMRFPEDTELISRQRGVVWQLIKNAATNMMEGKDLVSLSMPVTLFEPRSFLERMADGWGHLIVYLGKAAAAVDRVERVKFVATAIVAGLHNKCAQIKPFNPILGETWEAVYPDGTKIFAEQSSHHPPVSNWVVSAPDGSWVFHGKCQWEASMRGNTVKGGEKGTCVVEFPGDGTKITFEMPRLSLRGIVWGERIADFTGPMSFVDAGAGISCAFTFNPDLQSTSGYLKSFIWTPTNPSDYFKGEVTLAAQPGAKPKKICDVSGSWLSHIEFGGAKYWEKGAPYGRAVYPTPVEDCLPSDCRYREDLAALKAGDIDLAQSEKHRLEEAQRRDRKLRAAAKKARL